MPHEFATLFFQKHAEHNQERTGDDEHQARHRHRAEQSEIRRDDVQSDKGHAQIYEKARAFLHAYLHLQERSRFLVNLGVTFIGLDIIAAYFGLFGTMAVTGLMFVVTGVFLIVFGVFLEKKRRKFMQQIKTTAVKEAL